MNFKLVRVAFIASDVNKVECVERLFHGLRASLPIQPLEPARGELRWFGKTETTSYNHAGFHHLFDTG